MLLIVTERGRACADAMIANDLRDDFFKGQALMRIYKGQDPMFKLMHKEFKKFEDIIGAWEKWDSIYRKSGKYRFKVKRERARAKLAEKLSEYNWTKNNGSSRKTARFKTFIEQYNFGGYQGDKSFVTKSLADHVDILDAKAFDLTYLEHGNGLHELRKEIRWILHETRNLRGLVQYKPQDQCPVKELKDIVNSEVANKKYAKLESSKYEVKPCYISKCTYLNLVDMVDQLGEMKDTIEVYLNVNDLQDEDLTPQKYKIRAEKIYDKMKAYRSLQILSGEFKQCI